MAAKLVIAPEVVEDLAEASAWYESRRTGLGEELLSCVDACVATICRMPEMNATIHEQYRRGLTRRFPHAVFYEYADDTVTVYAVLHTARDPNKWRQRLP